MMLVTCLVLTPLEYMAAQTGLGVLHMVVSHFELVWLPTYLEHVWDEEDLEAERSRMPAKMARFKRYAHLRGLRKKRREMQVHMV